MVVGRSSHSAFEDNERPTAKRDRPDAVDLANASNQTQKLNPRELLGDKLDALPSSPPSRQAPPPGTSSGTRAVVTPDEIERFVGERRAQRPVAEEEQSHAHDVAKKEPPQEVASARRRARFVSVDEGRVLFTPAFLLLAVLVALSIGAVVGVLLPRLR